MSGKTLSDKVWEQHIVRSGDGLPDLLYIDLHLIHEVTSPQAFDGLRLNGRSVRRQQASRTDCRSHEGPDRGPDDGSHRSPRRRGDF